MSDDFERAVLISFNFTGADPNLKRQAATYLDEAKKSPELWRLCIERFTVTAYPEVKFWCLQTLHETIRSGYGSFAVPAKAAVKAAVLAWVTQDCNNGHVAMPAYLRNKVAQTVVAVLQFEYPGEWPSFFQDLVGAMSQGEGVMDMFCRILVAVDEDLVSLDIPRSQDESQLSMHVKDSMREHSIADVAAAWYKLVETYHANNPGLATMVLQTMQRYIDWIDIGLVANDKFVALLESLIDSPSAALRGAAVDCITGIVSKRMEAGQKLALIQRMGIVPLCERWSSGFPVLDSGDDDLLIRCARLLSTLAAEVMECLKRVENGIISMNAMGFEVGNDATQDATATSELASQLLARLFPVVLGAFKSDMDEVALPLLPFMSAYVNRLKTMAKRGQGLPAEALLHICAILEGLAISARYPADSMNEYQGVAPSAVQLAAAREEQAEVEEKRRELLTLYKNIAKLALGETLSMVNALLQRITTQPNTTWQEVELAVQLLYEVGEGAPEEALRPESGALAQLALALMQATLPASQHRLVSLVVLETLVRYGRVAQHHQQAMPSVLMTFLDVRGMGHASDDVSTRACYLFNRLVKTLRSSLKPYIPTILQNLQPHLIRVATTPLLDVQTPTPTRSESTKPGALVHAIVDDRLYIFDAVGQLLGQEDLLGAEEQLNLTSSLLQPLMRQIESSLQAQSAGSPGLIIQAMESVGRLNKGYKPDLCTRVRPRIGAMFIKTLEVAMVVPRVYSGHKMLRARFIALLHRMVESLQATLLPYLPAALEVLVSTQTSLEAPSGMLTLTRQPWGRPWRTHSTSSVLLPCVVQTLPLPSTPADAADMTEVLQVLNQLIVRFRASLGALLDQVLPVVLARAHALLPPDWDWSGKAASPAALTDGTAIGASQDDARERGELQRTYYSMLCAVADSGLSGSLLKVPPPALDSAMRALTRGAATHVDASVRKTCMLVFVRLMADWCGGGADLLPGFRRFVMEKVGGEACVAGLLQGGLDARDAGTVALVGEVAAVLKLVYAQCGDEFPTYLLSTVLPSVGCPAALQQQLVYHVRESDVKALKECLRTLMLQRIGGGGSVPNEK